jgi:hypothetical protein
MFSKLGLAALAATGAGAIMIPPELTMKADSPLQTFGVDPFSQLVKIPCPGCPFADFNDRGVSWSAKANYLVANVSVSADSKTLELNGHRFYPPLLSVKSVLNAGEPEVLQLPAEVSLDDIRSHPARIATPGHSLRLTAWSLQVGSVHTSGTSGEDLVNLHLRIHAIEQHDVHIPEVMVTAVKDKKGDLLLVKVEAADKPMSPKESQKECHNFPMLCKWRAFVADKLEAMRHRVRPTGSGCSKRPGLVHHHGKKPHHRPHHHKAKPKHHKAKPNHHKTKPNHDEAKPKHHIKPHNKGKPHHAKPHHHHHGHKMHHHKMHRFMHKLARVLLTIVIPILGAILAGMIIYLVGMVVGTGIALIWTKVRGRRAQYAPIALDDDDVEQREFLEKDEFAEEEAMEAPPQYVEAEEK